MAFSIRGAAPLLNASPQTSFKKPPSGSSPVWGSPVTDKGPNRTALAQARSRLTSREKRDQRDSRAAIFAEKQAALEARKEKRRIDEAKQRRATGMLPAIGTTGWQGLDPAEERLRTKLYAHKRAEVEAAFHETNSSGDGLLTRQEFECALKSLSMWPGDTEAKHVWRIYEKEPEMLQGGRLSLGAFMQRFTVRPPTSHASPTTPGMGEPANEMDFTASVLKNHQVILQKCRQRDSARCGSISTKAFFQVLASIGLGLNQVERHIVANKFCGSPIKSSPQRGVGRSPATGGVRYADFLRSFMARSSLV